MYVAAQFVYSFRNALRLIQIINYVSVKNFQLSSFISLEHLSLYLSNVYEMKVFPCNIYSPPNIG